MPSRSSSPAPGARSSSPARNPSQRSESPVNSARSSSPSRPRSGLIKGIAKRMNSTFRRNSVSFADEVAPRSSSSRPSSPEPSSIRNEPTGEPEQANIERVDAPEPTPEVVDAAPAAPAANESEPVKTEEPEAIEQVPAAVDPEFPVTVEQSHEDLSHEHEVQVETEVVQHVDEPTSLEHEQEHEPETVPEEPVPVSVGHPSQLVEDDEDPVEVPPSMMDASVIQEPGSELAESHLASEAESIATAAPLPSLNVEGDPSLASSIPVPELIADSSPVQQTARILNDPFGTPSTRHSNLGGDEGVQIVQPESSSQIERLPWNVSLSVPSGAGAPNVPSPFDREAFDQLVDDFAEKAAARLLSNNDDASTRNASPVTRTSGYNFPTTSTYSYSNIANIKSPIQLPGNDAATLTSRWEASDAAIQATLQRLASVDLSAPSPASTTAPNRLSQLLSPSNIPGGAGPQQTLLIPKWDEHRLPDGSLYWSRPLSYDLPMLLLVTDIDLRENGALRRVENFLARSSSSSSLSGGGGFGLGLAAAFPGAPGVNGELESLAGSGQVRDIWLAFAAPVGPAVAAAHRVGETSAAGAAAVASSSSSVASEADHQALKLVIIDHSKRESIPHPDIKRKEGEGEDEISSKLGMEHGYWSFVEAHPAHRAASERDNKDAMEFLGWCMADQLVSPQQHQEIQYPFTSSQCRELIELLRTVDNGQNGSASALVKTRIVAKVSLRNVVWRQQIYAAHKSGEFQEVSASAPEASNGSSEPNQVTPLLPGSSKALRRVTGPPPPGAVRGGLRLMVSRMFGYV